MKAFLRLKGKIRPRRKLSAISDQPSALSIWQYIKYCALDKVRYIRTFLQSILVFVSCSAALAQESVVHTTPASQAEAAASNTINTHITPLKIGDKIPDELWEMYFPVVSAKSDQVQYLSLGDFKDKLIILDFWATWCAPCISSLHKLDTLQQQLKDDLMVIPTSYEPESKIKTFLVNRKIGLPSLIEERELKKYFPHLTVPHQVWIKNGVFITTAQSEYASFNNVVKILNNEKVNILRTSEKSDLDLNLPLLSLVNKGEAKLLYHSAITTRISADIARTSFKDSGITAYNSSLMNLFQVAYSIPRYPLNSRVLLEITDPALRYKVLGPPEKSFVGNWEIDNALINWKSENTFSYSTSFPNKVPDSIRRKKMQQELNSFFSNYWGLQAKVEKRKVKCMALIKLGSKQDFITKGGESLLINNTSVLRFVNQPIENLISSLSVRYLNLGIPIVNATGYSGKIDLEINGDLNNIDDLNTKLKAVGLTLIELYEEVPMLIIFQS